MDPVVGWWVQTHMPRVLKRVKDFLSRIISSTERSGNYLELYLRNTVIKNSRVNKAIKSRVKVQSMFTTFNGIFAILEAVETKIVN